MERTPTPAQRIRIDATWGRYRDLIVALQGVYGEVIAVQLTIEAELEDRLAPLIPHPDALLGNAGFHQKLTLLCALHPAPDLLKDAAIQHIRRLNKIRNMIAHGERPRDVSNQLTDLLNQAAPDYRASDKSPAATIDALRGLMMELCGFLAGVTEGPHFEALQRRRIGASDPADD
jgi:hypothetical protein